jgi:hypothetical protein
LKATRYRAISSSSAHRQPGRLPLTFSTNALTSIRHPGQDIFQAFRIEVGPTACDRACRTKRTLYAVTRAWTVADHLADECRASPDGGKRGEGKRGEGEGVRQRGNGFAPQPGTMCCPA